MKVLLDAPLTDIGAVYSGRDLASSGSQITVPTSINADHMHFAQLRLDYALASKGLIEASEAAAEAINLLDGLAEVASKLGGLGLGQNWGAGRGVGPTVGRLAHQCVAAGRPSGPHDWTTMPCASRRDHRRRL